MKTANQLGSLYSHLPQNIQNAIQSTPEIGNILSRGLPPAITSEGQQKLQRNP
jgi:hypothetical protein